MVVSVQHTDAAEDVHDLRDLELNTRERRVERVFFHRWHSDIHAQNHFHAGEERPLRCVHTPSTR